MAAVFGHMDYWNISGSILAEEIRKGLSDITTGQATVMSICYVLLSIVTVVGNALVIIAVWKDPLKTLRSSPSNAILVSLAVADLMVGLVLAPGAALFYLRFAVKAQPWIFLMFVIEFSHFFLAVSVFHILLLTIDRYFALAKPLKYRAIVTKGRVAVVSSFIWVFCFCYGVLSSILKVHFFVSWFIYVLIIWFCSEWVSCLYLATLKQLCKHYKTRITAENSQSNLMLLYQREKKVCVVILSVILVFYFCFLPWLVNQFLFFFCQSCHKRAWMVFYHVATLLLFINSAVNPLLYSWRFSKFRATFKHFWTNCRCKKGRGRRKTISITDGRQRETYNTKL